jgi:hypothetical protein
MKIMLNPFPKEVTAEPALFQVLEQMHHLDGVRAQLREDVKFKLADKRKLRPEEILLGSSTTATTGLVFMYLKDMWDTVAKRDHEDTDQRPKALVPSPTYNGIVSHLNAVGWDVIEQEYQLPELYTSTYFDTFIKTIREDKPYLIVMANPNNPTGAYFTQENIAAICAEVEKYGGYVVVDEAYLSAVDADGTLSSVQLLSASNDETADSDSNLPKTTNLIVLESVHKNWPTHIKESGENTHFSSNTHKMALVYSSEQIIDGMKELVEIVKLKAGFGDEDAIDFLRNIMPSAEGIFILQLALLDPVYWQNVAHALMAEMSFVLESLHNLENVAMQVGVSDDDEAVKFPSLLLPKETINGVFVVGVLKKAINEAMGVGESGKTAVQALNESGVAVQPVFETHNLAQWYEFFRVVIQDPVQNQAFVHAFGNLFA